MEVATTTPGYRYELGSVLNQVLLHQTIIGLEVQAALKKYNIKPDVLIGCTGGGSNLGGFASPFLGEMLRGEAKYKIIGAEPASCPSFTRGIYAYDFDGAVTTPILNFVDSDLNRDTVMSAAVIDPETIFIVEEDPDSEEVYFKLEWINFFFRR